MTPPSHRSPKMVDPHQMETPYGTRIDVGLPNSPLTSPFAPALQELTSTIL